MAIIFTNNTYPFKHWLTSLGLGPLFQIIYATLFDPEYKFTNDSLGTYLLFFLFSLFFSFPVFVIYLMLFNLFIKKIKSLLLVKSLLNLITILSVYIIIQLIGGTAMTMTLSTIYSVAIIISSSFYKIKKQNTADT